MSTLIQPTGPSQRDIARDILRSARFAALGVLGPDGAPVVTRIAFGLSPQGQPLSLVSDLATHTQALKSTPSASLLLSEPGLKGDPLTHLRLTLQVTASFANHGSAEHAELAAHYLRDHPKAKLYIGFTDFSFALFQVRSGFLNAGFGKAHALTPADLS